MLSRNIIKTTKTFKPRMATIASAEHCSKRHKSSGINIDDNGGSDLLTNLLDVLEVTTGVTAAIGLGVGAFAYDRYRVSKPDEYLVRTGLGIKDMIITKKGVQWPFQTYRFVNMKPSNFNFDLQAMSSEKMEFVLPGVFTIGPQDNIESIQKYVKLISSNDTEMNVLVKGILEGETRVLAAQLTIEQIFNDRKAFKEELVNQVQDELDQFGLKIYNANVADLHDSPGSEYFSFLRQKKRSESENRAKVDVAEANKAGAIGEKAREAITRQEVAQFEATTVLEENKQHQSEEKSKAELAVVKAEAFQRTKLAQIEADKTTQIRDAELQRTVEEKRIMMETEKLRATDLSRAQVMAEKLTKEAEGQANAMKTIADATLYSKQREADGILYSKEKEAEGILYSKEKEAEGILALYTAQSEGAQKLIQSFGAPATAIQYLMLENGLFEKLSKTNADAIKGLNPKITIWNTGSDAGSDSYTKPIADILKMIPPLATTIYDQTGVKPADWMMIGVDGKDRML